MLYDAVPDLTVMSDLLPGKLDGIYCLDTNTILIDRRLTYTQKRCALVHELVHWHYGDDGDGRYTAKQERRARLTAARLLIDPIEYATAERMYDGDSYLIAQTLDRTVQVIDDYKSLLHDSAA